MARSPTPEQEEICAAAGRLIKANAFAGTGKSSTLEFLAQRYPNKRWLYVAFNRAIQQEAAARFPGNVQARTGHSLGYASKGRIYGAVKDKLCNDIKPFHVIPALGVRSPGLRNAPSETHNLYGGRVIETVKAFLTSADEDLGLGHVSLGDSPAEKKYFDRSGVLADARVVWSAMCDPGHAIPMVHDGYLKLYQLSEPRLSFDGILLDEAQDTNPVLQAIVGAQQGRIFYVGDRHQSIYAFRGAANAMEDIRADAEFGLTGSFRFGEAVAGVANQLLALKGEHRILRGLGAASACRQIDVWRESHACISRGNATLFHEAAAALAAGRPFAFVGDLRGYRFDQIADAYNMFAGEAVRDPFTRSFASFDEFAEYGEAMDDRDVKARVKLVNRYGDEIPGLIEKITKKALPFTDNWAAMPARTLVLTTAHKSKGLEFDAVRMTDDFMPLIDEEGELFSIGDASRQDIEEVNLQYVAATRARKVLQVTQDIMTYQQSLGSVQTTRIKVAIA